MISVVGTSFVFLPIAQDAVSNMVAAGSTDCDGAPCTGREAYGKFLGTCMVAVWLEVLLSFIKPNTLKKLFPPLVSGVCIICIGAGLTGTGLKYWGGGVWCQEHFDERAFDSAQRGGNAPSCSGNGEVKLPYGSPEYFWLGSSCFFMMVFVELVGNPFMKNCNVVISLLFGYFVAALSSLDPENPYAVPFGADCSSTADFSMSPPVFGAKFNPCDADDSQTLDFVTSAKMDIAPGFTFLWVETFPLGFYGPAFLPLLIGVLVSTVETVGDIGASAIASKLDDGKTKEEFEDDVYERIQGGLLADGLNSFVAALFTQLPNTTYSQNNGVIALTNCGSKAAGIACCCWLIFFGVFAKVAALITSIPDCVLGGVTTFLFANVVVSGIAIIARDEKFIAGDRRARAILMLSLGVGIGVTMKPGFIEASLANSFKYGLWPKDSTCLEFCSPAVDAVAAANHTCLPAASDGSTDGMVLDCSAFTDSCTCQAIDGCEYTAAVAATDAVASSCGADVAKIWGVQSGTTNCANWGGSRSFRDAVIIILKTPMCIGPLLAMILNLILPETDLHDDEEEETKKPAPQPEPEASA